MKKIIIIIFIFLFSGCSSTIYINDTHFISQEESTVFLSNGDQFTANSFSKKYDTLSVRGQNGLITRHSIKEIKKIVERDRWKAAKRGLLSGFILGAGYIFLILTDEEARDYAIFLVPAGLVVPALAGGVFGFATGYETTYLFQKEVP